MKRPDHFIRDPFAGRRANSHLSWCRLLVVAYGSLKAAYKALDPDPVLDYELSDSQLRHLLSYMGEAERSKLPDSIRRWWFESEFRRARPLLDQTVARLDDYLRRVRLVVRVHHQREPGEHRQVSGLRACDWQEKRGIGTFDRERAAWAEAYRKSNAKTPNLREFPGTLNDYRWHWAARRPSCETCQVLEDAAIDFRGEFESPKRDASTQEMEARRRKARKLAEEQFRLAL